jgi:hypothetical protein
MACAAMIPTKSMILWASAPLKSWNLTSSYCPSQSCAAPAINKQLRKGISEQ